MIYHQVCWSSPLSKWITLSGETRIQGAARTYTGEFAAEMAVTTCNILNMNGPGAARAHERLQRQTA